MKDYADESQSDGSCYSFATPTQVMCDVGHAACDAMGACWYSPGFISISRISGTSCCHCDASCDHTLENPQVQEKSPGWNCNASIPNDCDPIDWQALGCSMAYYGADGTQGSGGGHGAEYSYGAWQTLAGYQTATDIDRPSRIDLDMDELETKVGEYATNANWVAEAMFIYENGGGGLCSQADVDDPAIIQCYVVGGPKGNSVKGSGARK